MNIHEYQAKEILSRYAVPVPEGYAAFSAEEAVGIARRIGGSEWVVKAQIHAGGRGKGGGVKLAQSIEDVDRIARSMIGMRLVTHQTGSEGRIVKRVLVAKSVSIAKELYFGITLDRSSSRNVVMA
jgi:succinyl-CoA synthetase beta subunit